MVVVQTVEGSWDTCNLGRNLLSGSVNLYLTVSPGVSIPSICVTPSDNERYWVLMIVFSSAAFRYSAGFSFESKFVFNFPECTGELSWLPSQQNYELPTLLDTGEHTGSGPLQCMANPPMQRAFPPRVGEDGWTQRLIHLGSGCLSARGIVEINVYYVWCSIICNVNCGEHFKWTWSLVTFWPKWRERWEPTYLMLALTHQPPRAPPMHSSSPPQPRRLGAETNLLGKWLLVSERRWGNKIACFSNTSVHPDISFCLYTELTTCMWPTIQCCIHTHFHAYACKYWQILWVRPGWWWCFWWRWRWGCHNQKY